MKNIIRTSIIPMSRSFTETYNCRSSSIELYTGLSLIFDHDCWSATSMQLTIVSNSWKTNMEFSE